MNENMAVVGVGVVGKATATLFGIEKKFDIDETKSTATLPEIAECRYIFVCLPTPVKNGDYVTSDISAIVRQINDYRQGPIFIIRSTVWPGYSNSLFSEVRPEAVISNPEFLSEDTWQKDIRYPPFILIGGSQGRFLEEVSSLYRNVTKHAPIILTDNITAEAAKLVMNAFFATKVVFANQMYDWAQKAGANYERIKEVLEKHPFGMKNHATIWYKGKRGVHGKCLPKDLEAFANSSKLPILESVWQYNEQIKNQTEG